MMRHLITILFLFLGVVTDVDAQATAMPTFYAPTRGFRSYEAGVTLSRPGGTATSLEGRYGAALERADIAFRAGYVERNRSRDGNFAAGIEARVPVLSRSPTFPLDGSLVVGVGHIFRSNSGQTIVPVGLTLGRRFHLDGSALHITPYLQPTVVFEDEARLTTGLGIDIHIRDIPNLRLAWALGDLDGFSAGLYWPR